MTSVLILCTGNSCRSQMAEGFLRELAPDWEVVSAGTRPASAVHPDAITVMREVGIDLTSYKPESVDRWLGTSFDYVITVCDNARETCPVFAGEVGNKVHIGFDDPAEAVGNEEEILTIFRQIRDQIHDRFAEFYREKSGS